jgi:signal transduction histidine kinase
VEVGEVLPRVLQRLDPGARARGVRIALTSDSRRRLRNREANILLLVVENLAANALEAAPDHSEVRIVSVDGPEGDLQVRVADGGPGITPAVLAHLFEPTVSTKPGGSGLGLAITRQLALSVGGDVLLEGTGPAGSCFMVRLPSVSPDGPGMAAESCPRGLRDEGRDPIENT